MDQSAVFGKVKGHSKGHMERSKVKGQRSSSIYGLFILIWKGQRSTPKVKGQMTSSIYGLFCLIWYLKGQRSTQRSKVICHIWTILPYLAARGQRSLLDQNPYGTILLCQSGCSLNSHIYTQSAYILYTQSADSMLLYMYITKC